MKISNENCFIAEKPGGWVIKIEVPSYHNRNYIHCPLITDLQDCVDLRDFILDKHINPDNTTAKKEGTYYRLHVDLSDEEGRVLSFHSRKLNIVDLIFEWDLYTKDD